MYLSFDTLIASTAETAEEVDESFACRVSEIALIHDQVIDGKHLLLLRTIADQAFPLIRNNLTVVDIAAFNLINAHARLLDGAKPRQPSLRRSSLDVA